MERRDHLVLEKESSTVGNRMLAKLYCHVGRNPSRLLRTFATQVLYRLRIGCRDVTANLVSPFVVACTIARHFRVSLRTSYSYSFKRVAHSHIQEAKLSLGEPTILPHSKLSIVINDCR